jgi:ion channel-forming bestrophin family protein
VIDYELSAWWRTCFSFFGTVLPRILGRVGLLTGFSLSLVLLDEYVLKPQRELPALDQLGHSVLGVALGLLIVFRTNTSYNRFWEARSCWGMLLNCARNLVREAAVFAGPADDLARLVAAYVVAIRENLRGNRDLTPLRALVSGRVLDELKQVNNPPSHLAKLMSEWVKTRLAERRIDTYQAMQLERIICTMVDSQGACEKIRKTPLPFVYAALIKQILFLYLGTLPFVLVNKMGFAAPLVVSVVGLGILGIEEAGVEIEDPFGLDPNDLPLEAICETIARDTADLAKSG